MTLAAAEHVRILAAAGHSISIVGAYDAVLREELPVSCRIHVPAHGSGAIYAPARIDRDRIAAAVRGCLAELVIVEGWQTALTDATVDVAFSLGVPVLMVSHGSSVHSFTRHPTDMLRSLAWFPYRWGILPGLISRLSALTTLDETSTSYRFFDRDVARHLGVPVLPLANAPVNWLPYFFTRQQRKRQILVVGYFSPIKNQLAAVEIAARLPSSLQFLFVGRKHGWYFEKCVRRAAKLGLSRRATFVEDHECNLAEEMSRSLIVLLNSVTEALPLTLLEAMASGTPFVATPVGAVPSLRGGMLASNASDFLHAVQSLVTDASLWQRYSEEGRHQHGDRFSRKHVEAQLHTAVDIASRMGACESRLKSSDRVVRGNLR